MLEKDLLIVVYIDLDDDLGRAGINTPIIGEEDFWGAVKKFGLQNPNDSDLNTMYSALKAFKTLKEKGVTSEIVALTGSQEGGPVALLNLEKQLNEVISKLSPKKALIVYDSPEDERAIPLIQSKLEVLGTEKVIVEQYRGVEETYALIGKYLKKLIEEPRYSRLFLGVPGIILVISGILAFMGYQQYIAIAIAITLGITMIFRGLAIDDLISSWWENSPIFFIASALSLISLLVGIITSYYVVNQSENHSVAFFFYNLIPFIEFSMIILFIGKAIIRALQRSIRIWHDITGAIVVFLISPLISEILFTISYGITPNTFYPLIQLALVAVVIVAIPIAFMILEKIITSRK